MSKQNNNYYPYTKKYLVRINRYFLFYFIFKVIFGNLKNLNIKYNNKQVGVSSNKKYPKIMLDPTFHYYNLKDKQNFRNKGI